MEKIVIDLKAGKDVLDESWLKMFGMGISSILNAMFGGTSVPVTVRGSRDEVSAFSKVIGREKRYMDAYTQFGLDNPNTYKSKFQLNKAVRDFERKTGLKYPLR